MFLTKTIFLVVISLFVVNAKPAIDYCQTCQNVNEFINQMKLNQTEKVIETNLYKKCFEENNKSNSEVCIFLSTSIKNTLFSIGSSDFCKKIDACSSNTSLKKLESVNHERCGFCTDFVNSAKSLIEESSIAEIKTVVNDYCSVMGDFQETCENAVRENLSNIIDFVLKKLDSEKFCHSINSCHYQSLEDKKLPSLGDLSSLRNPEVMKGHLDDLYENKVNEIIEPENNLEAGIGCMVCRQVVVFAYHRLSKNATRQELEVELSHACKALYPKNKEKEQICEQKVIKNIDVIIRGFVEKIPPELLCLALGFCIGDKEQINLKDFSNELVKVDLECEICDKVIEFAYKELNLNKTRNAIKHFIGKSCPKIFKKDSSRTECQKYVETYTDTILDFFEAGLSPGLICNALHLCKVNERLVNKYDNSLLEMELTPTTDVGESNNFKLDGCQTCKTMYPLIYKFLQNQEVKGIFKASIPMFCDAHIYPIKDCTETLNNIVDTFSTVEDSNVGCKQMNYCTNDTIIEQNIDNSGDNFSPRCSACKLMVKDLYNMFNKKINGENMHKLVERGCGKVPEIDQEKCKNEAIIILNKAVKQLEESFPPIEVCELMEYCKKSIEIEDEYLENKKNYCEECKVEANKHLNKFKTFKTIINADQICESFNYCQKKKSNNEKVNKTPAEKACSECHLFFPFLHIAFQNEEFKRIYTEIGINMCKKCPSKDCVSKLKETIESITKNSDVEEACKPVCKKTTHKNLSLKFKGLCDDCENVFASIHKKVESFKDTKDQIIQFLLGTCPEKDTKCKEFYKKNINLVYKKILEATDPSSACKILCKSQKKTCHKNCKKDNKVVKPKKNHCSRCNKFFNRVHQEINNSDLIYKKITSFFNQTFSEKNSELKFFYQNNKELIHQFVLNKTNPEIVCPKSDTCNISALDNVNTNEDQDSLCKGCQKGLLYLKQRLDTPEFQKELADEIVTTICAKIGNILERKLCTKFVNQYGPKLIQQLGNQIVNVDKICTEDLKLCTEQKTNINFELINFKADEKCSICMKSVQKLNNVQRETPKISVKDVCGEEDEECITFMIEFLDYFLKRNDFDDSLKACSSLDFCLSPGKVKLLGGVKCTYGPSYWCVSSDHSEACKATEFCRKKVWKTIEN